MEDKRMNVTEEMNENTVENTNELFEEVEEVITASWTGCANCCN